MDKYHIRLMQRMFDEAFEVDKPNPDLEEIKKTMAILELCESPIEMLLAVSLLWSDHTTPSNNNSRDNPLILTKQEDEFLRDRHRLLIPQYQWEGYRIDLVLRDNIDAIFIECDGHDFHERTKQQAEYDRRRDREVQKGGYPIMRFTGSEIYRDPGGCADEVFDLISSLEVGRYFQERAWKKAAGMQSSHRPHAGLSSINGVTGKDPTTEG